MIRKRVLLLATLTFFISYAPRVSARIYFPTVGSVRGSSVINAPVLLFHYVRQIPLNDPLGAQLSVDPEQFKRQIEYLIRHGYTPVTPDFLFAALQSRVRLPENPVILTFDDGTEDFASTVLPIATSYGVPVTVYVIPGFIGASGYMSWQQLRTVSASPLVTIGGHGLNHVPLTSLPRDVARRQLILTKNVLTTLTGQPVRSFAYPNGQYSKEIVSLVSDAGYTIAFTTRKGADHVTSKRLELPRLHAGSSVTSLQQALSQ